MALRIGGPKQAPQEEPDTQDYMPTDMPDQAAATDMPAMMDEGMQDDGDEGSVGPGMTSKSTAGYLGPEDGPFKCGTCLHFSGQDKGTCDIVSGHIDAEGCCNLFAKGGEVEADPDMQMEDLSQEPEADNASEEGY